MELLKNKKARHNYEILEKFEAGIKLNGSEVKSLRNKHGSLKEAYIKFKDELGTFVLSSCHIPPYQGGHKHYDEQDISYRERKLLLHKKQIQRIRKKIKQRGLTVIPLNFFTKGKLIKMEIAIARGKKKYDKRQDLKKRAVQRDLERMLKK